MIKLTTCNFTHGIFMITQFIQKRDPKYCEVKEETAWSMDRFNEYVNENVAALKGLPQDWVFGHLDVSYAFRQRTYSVFYFLNVI